MSQLASMSGPLAYRAIKRRLAREIGARWKPGSRLPTIADLAQQLGTGHRNTHRAVRELVDDGILISRPGLGTFVSGELSPDQLPDRDVPDSLDLAIGDKPMRLVGRVVAVVHSEGQIEQFQHRMADAFIAAIKESGASVRLVPARDDPPAAPREPQFIADVDAVILINPDANVPIDALENQLVCIMSTATQVTVRMTGRYDVVTLDQIGGGVLAGRRLADAGCQTSCFIGVRAAPRSGADQLDATSTQRLTGFQTGWGPALPPPQVIASDFYDVGMGARLVQQYLQLSPRPQAVFCASDELAVGFVTGALAHSLDPGTDYRIVGFDGQDRGRNCPEGPLTTVEVPVDEIGRRAAEMLETRFENPDQPVRRLHLGCRLFEGETVKPSMLRVKARAAYRR